MKFVLPYIIAGEPKTRSFIEVDGFFDIALAADSAQKNLTEKYTISLKRRVNVAVAHIDFSNRNRETGELLPQPAPQPAPFRQPYRRRRPYRRW